MVTTMKSWFLLYSHWDIAVAFVIGFAVEKHRWGDAWKPRMPDCILEVKKTFHE